MKLVHIKDVKAPAMCYMNVPQPMAIYYSVEEFEANVRERFEIIHSIGSYLEFITKYQINLTYNSNNKYIDVIDKNVWIRTVDEFVPDVANFAGEITYKLDAEGKRIPTDGCFIQLFYITPTPTRNILFTSAGVNTVGMTKWNPTAAQRYNYSQESDPRAGMDKASIYKDRLEKIQRTRKESVQMVKIVSAMLNPSSVNFLDFNASVKSVYPWIKAVDRGKLLETESFKRALMSVLKTFYPELRDAIRKVHTPEEMAKKLQIAFEVAKDKKDVKGMLEVFGNILTTGYEENFVVNDTTGHILPKFEPKQLNNGETEMPNDKFLAGEPELSMIGMVPGVEISEEEIKNSYPSSFVGMDNEEIEKMIGDN